MQGTIFNVCVSTRKGTPKRAVDRVFLRRHHGLEGDAHSGDWHRQVSLLDAGDISGGVRAEAPRRCAAVRSMPAVPARLAR